MVSVSAKQSWGRRRRPRRGLTVFIVLLVIGMLFAVGTFAAKMASSGVANSGRFRQMIQTHYISDMGMQASLSELQRDPNGYRIMMRDTPPPGAVLGEFPCKETPDPDGSGVLLPANPACVRIGYTGFRNVARTKTGDATLEIIETKGPQVNGLSGAPGSLGFGNIDGNFAAELSDLMVDAPPPGFPAEQLSHMAFYRITVLATGQVRPWNTATAAPYTVGSDQFEFMVSQEDTRAQVVFGPVPK